MYQAPAEGQMERNGAASITPAANDSRTSLRRGDTVP